MSLIWEKVTFLIAAVRRLMVAIIAMGGLRYKLIGYTIQFLTGVKMIMAVIHDGNAFFQKQIMDRLSQARTMIRKRIPSVLLADATSAKNSYAKTVRFLRWIS